MPNKILYSILIMLVALLSGCREAFVPRPYGYFRIALPEPTYHTYTPEGMPYTCLLSDAAVAQLHAREGEHGWLDITYPSLNVKIHCSYKPVTNNLGDLGRDAQEFVYKHSGIASAIPEQGFEAPEAHVYGVLYELRGNTASPCQFYVTDSLHHFFRGAVYFNCVPNQDSLAPVTDFMIQETRHLIESIQWQ